MLGLDILTLYRITGVGTENTRMLDTGAASSVHQSVHLSITAKWKDIQTRILAWRSSGFASWPRSYVMLQAILPVIRLVILESFSANAHKWNVKPYGSMYFWKGADLSFPKMYTYLGLFQIDFELHWCIFAVNDSFMTPLILSELPVASQISRSKVRITRLKMIYLPFQWMFQWEVRDVSISTAAKKAMQDHNYLIPI